MFLAGYEYYLRTAASLQWDEGAIGLERDVAKWPSLARDRRERLSTLLAGFVIGELSVAAHLDPFAEASIDPVAADCFRAQARDEARHARFFTRVAAEVVLPGLTPAERERALRARLPPDFVELFEERLPALAESLREEGENLAAAVSLYHMVLEGVVFTAGQLALLDLLEQDEALPGVLRGVQLVLRDERWHVGFGARALDRLAISSTVVDELSRAARPAVEAWGDAVPSALKETVIHLHRRRLRASHLIPQERVS